MKYLRVVLIAVMISGFFTAVIGTNVTTPGDYAIFLQKEADQKTLYIVTEDGSTLRKITAGKDITSYVVGHHLLIYSDRQLLEYDLPQQTTKLLAEFKKDVDFCYAFAMKPSGPDQALVVTGSQYGTFLRWYVLEFSDGSLRKIDPPFDSLPSGKPGESSPDGNAEAVIKRISFGSRFEVQIIEKTAGKSGIVWTMPKEMTGLPAYPVWAPNSRLVAFYGKELKDGKSLTGSYSLYVYDLDRKELKLVQDGVFTITGFEKVEMGEFRPDWSGDSKYLIVEYRPYGFITESSILRYEIGSGKKVFLNNSPGEKRYPSWSPSGNSILFLSSREGKGYQLYTMDSNGNKVTRLSPPEGITEWAKWLRFE